jgi:chorismate mutase
LWPSLKTLYLSMINMPDLNIIALQLEGLEETIIYHLIERVQYRKNSVVYEPGASGFRGYPRKSLMEIRLLFHERMDAQFGRFCVPEERPFSGRLPRPRRTVHLPVYPLALRDFNLVNLTAAIEQAYTTLVNIICRDGDDGQYGSSVENDVYALQAISRRIHYGAMYVAEAKYRADPGRYNELIRTRDRTRLMHELTRKEVEARIINRVKDKVARAQARSNLKIRIPIDPESVLAFYRDSIIPLTKEGEIIYLINRREILS